MSTSLAQESMSLTMLDSTGASRVLPVVHICRRQKWEEVAAAEKEMADTDPVTKPTYNRSGR